MVGHPKCDCEYNNDTEMFLQSLIIHHKYIIYLILNLLQKHWNQFNDDLMQKLLVLLQLLAHIV